MIDHVRSSRKTKRTPRGKIKTKTKAKKKTELAVTLSFPKRNYDEGTDTAAQAGLKNSRSRLMRTRPSSISAGSSNRRGWTASRSPSYCSSSSVRRTTASTRHGGRSCESGGERHRPVRLQARVLHATGLRQRGDEHVLDLLPAGVRRASRSTGRHEGVRRVRRQAGRAEARQRRPPPQTGQPQTPGQPQQPGLGPPLQRLTPTSTAAFWRSRYYRSARLPADVVGDL